MSDLSGATPAGAGERGAGPDLPVTFRPYVARRWSYIIGGLVLAASIVMAVLISGEHTRIFDRLGFLVVGAAVFWFCHRQASVRVTATADGLTVRNLFSTERYTWPEVFAVSFPVGDAWAHLDLSNGETISTMALQRADRARGVAAARELNGLIQRYSSAH